MQFISVCLHSMPRCSLCKNFTMGKISFYWKQKHTKFTHTLTVTQMTCRWVRVNCVFVGSHHEFALGHTLTLLLRFWHFDMSACAMCCESQRVWCAWVYVCVFLRVCVRMSEYVFVGNMRQGCVQWMAMNYMRLLSLLELFSYLFDNRSVCLVYSCIHIDNNGLPPILMGIHA